MIDAKTLQKFSLFQSLPEQEVSALAALFSHQKYQAGEFIIEENSLGNELFLLQKGEILC